MRRCRHYLETEKRVWTEVKGGRMLWPVPRSRNAAHAGIGLDGTQRSVHRHRSVEGNFCALHQRNEPLGRRDTRSGRWTVQHSLSQTSRRSLVWKTKNKRKAQENQNRTICHLGRSIGNITHASSHRGKNPGTPRTEKTVGHIHRCLAQAYQSRNRTYPHLLQSNHYHDRTVEQQ